MKERVFPDPIRELSVYHQPGEDKVFVVDDNQNHASREIPDGFAYTYAIREYALATGQPWDLWHTWALADGVPEELAALGRSVIQHADPHSFLREACCEFGWRDSGASMIRFAMEEPEVACESWLELLTRNGRWPSHAVVN